MNPTVEPQECGQQDDLSSMSCSLPAGHHGQQHYGCVRDAQGELVRSVWWKACEVKR